MDCRINCPVSFGLQPDEFLDIEKRKEIVREALRKWVEELVGPEKPGEIISGFRVGVGENFRVEEEKYGRESEYHQECIITFEIGSQDALKILAYALNQRNLTLSQDDVKPPELEPL